MRNNIASQTHINRYSRLSALGSRFSPLWLLVVPLCFCNLAGRAADHVVSIINLTGRTANDLHLVFTNKTSNPRCDQLTNTQSSPDGGYTYTFDTGSVSNWSAATVRWSSKLNPDEIQSGYWTWNGTNIGTIGETLVMMNYTNNPDGSALVTFVNTDTNPVTYANLRLFTGAPQAFFNPASFVDQMSNGQPVETFVAPSGTFPPGTTTIAEFHPSLAGYTAGAVLVNGGLFAFGSSPVAELSQPLNWGSQVLVELSGDAGRNYALQSSTDLVHWTSTATNPVTSSPAEFPMPASGPQNFFRGVSIPPINSNYTNGPCPGGVFVGGYTVSECITGYWHVVYYDIYACPPDWQRHTYRTKAVNTGQPCTSVLNESLSSAPTDALATRNITFDFNGGEFTSSSAAIDYSAALFPAQGTIELDVRSTTPGGWILDTRGIGTRVIGDAVLTINSTGQVFFAIDPIGGQNPLTLPGVTSFTMVNDGYFHTLSVSYGSAGLKMYVDGRLEDANVENNTPLVRSTVTVGDFLDAMPQSFIGSIRHIRTSAVQGDVQQPPALVEGQYIFINRTGQTVNDFHAVFTGSGGTLSNPKITAGTPDAVISAQGNTVDIVFPTPIPNGAPIAFTVQSRFVPIQLYSAWWTINGEPVGRATPFP
jgi:hypothetical protein